MRKAIIPFIIALMAVMTISAQSRAEVRASITIDKGGIRDADITIRPGGCIITPEITVVRERPLSPRQMAVAELIADVARVPVRRVVTLRNRDWSWMQITREFGLTANIFFVRVGHHSYPTCVKVDKDYKRAVKKMKKAIKQARKEIRRHGEVRLNDREIVRLVKWRQILVNYETRDSGRFDHRLAYDHDLSNDPPAKPVRGNKR